MPGKNIAIPFVMLVAILSLIALLPAQNTALGQSSSYTYEVDDLGDGLYDLDVDITDSDNDFTDYKTDNDSRISGWAASPSTAPQIDEQPVRVTFTDPQTYTDTLSILAPYLGEILAYRLVGYSSASSERYFDGWGDINGDLLEGTVNGPECDVDSSLCDPITYTGVISVDFEFDGGASDLEDLKDETEVFLADSTAIEILDSFTPGVTVFDVEQVAFPAAMFDSNGNANYP